MRSPGAAILLLCCCSLDSALAQVSGSATLVSDYLYRGVSLSAGDPAMQLTLAYDHPSGAFAGAFVSQTRLDAAGARGVHHIVYAGYARRLDTGLAWEAGLSNHGYPDASGRNYRELFVGLTAQRAGARLSWSPSYLGMDSRTVYAELNGSHALSENTALFAHVGYLRGLDGSAYDKADIRLGIGRSFAQWHVQLAVDAARTRQEAWGWYGRRQHTSSRKLVATVSLRF